MVCSVLWAHVSFRINVCRWASTVSKRKERVHENFQGAFSLSHKHTKTLFFLWWSHGEWSKLFPTNSNIITSYAHAHVLSEICVFCSSEWRFVFHIYLPHISFACTFDIIDMWMGEENMKRRNWGGHKCLEWTTFVERRRNACNKNSRVISIFHSGCEYCLPNNLSYLSIFNVVSITHE